MGSGASKTKALATDENMKKAAGAAQTAAAVGSAISNAEEGEGGAAAVGAISKDLTGNNKAAGAAAAAGASAIGGAVGAENPAAEEGNWFSTMLKVFSFAKKAKKMADTIQEASADGELTLGEIAGAAAKSGVLDAAVGAATGEETNFAKGGLSSLGGAATGAAAGAATSAAMGAVGDVDIPSADAVADIADVVEAVQDAAEEVAE